MYILYTSQQQNTLDGDVYIIHITTTEHFMVMYMYTSQQQNTLLMYTHTHHNNRTL